ncbi:MAG TPA: glycosyltransferase family 4 protein [Candidatus Nanopelagicales bacterium]|nr:glycosyltransferase family 4 protein [Candidatus Nanopelagicales bacterium]
MTGSGEVLAQRSAVAGIVDVILPAGIDDPARPSGGNAYDRRLCRELARARWTVREHQLAGAWPSPRDRDRDALARVLGRAPKSGLVLVDGLVASTAPEELLGAARRGVRLVVLVHLPLGVAASPGSPIAGRERAALAAADALIVTSRWTRDWLVEHYQLPVERLHVAEPGVDAAGLSRPAPGGGRLLCVGAIAPHKGQDVLLTALALLAEGPWRCLLIGPEADSSYARSVRDQVAAPRLRERVELIGPVTAAELAALYADTDLVVAPSRIETYGMVVSEALARGIPVVATTAGGLPRTVGLAADGTCPGLLVPPDDPVALAVALRRWLTDETLRHRLRAAAVARRGGLPTWSATGERVAATLTGLAA